MNKNSFVAYKAFDSRADLINFLDELNEKNDLSKIIIQIIKTASWSYELFYIDSNKETK